MAEFIEPAEFFGAAPAGLPDGFPAPLDPPVESAKTLAAVVNALDVLAGTLAALCVAAGWPSNP